MDDPLPDLQRFPSTRGRWLLAGVAALLVAVPIVVTRSGSWQLLLPSGTAREQRAHGTWRHLFDLHGVAAAIPLPLWLLALLGLSVLGFPYVWLVARALPDRGFAVSRIVGLLLVSWLVWWFASVRILPFSAGAIWLAALIVAGGSLLICLRHGRELTTWLRLHWKLLLLEEGIFWVLFLLAIYVRWSNPDLWHPQWGGEKPMDLAYLNAVAKSTSFPPYDPWFAGGAMNYYYFGFVQIASLAKLTGIPPTTAYNLALPTLAAMLGAAAFGAVLGAAPRSLSVRARLVVAGLAPVLVTVAGNLAELRVVKDALQGAVPNDWWFWNASRAIRPGPGEPAPITEFPAFTYIYGDLHAHAMALPLATLAVVLTVAVVRNGRGPGANLGALALTSLVLGALWVTNTWDLPTYSLVAICGLVLCRGAMPRSLRSIASLVAAVAGLLAAAYLSFLPFHLHYAAVFAGVQRWQGPRTVLTDYLSVHGLFLFAIVAGLVTQFAFARDLGSTARALRLRLRCWNRLGRLRRLSRTLVRPRLGHRLALLVVPLILVLAFAVAALGEGPTALAACVALLAVLAWPVDRRAGGAAQDRRLRRLVIVWILLGLSLTIAVEYLVLRKVDVGRMNTVFKLYLQVWVLWGLAAAVSVGTVYTYLRSLPRVLRAGWRIAIVLLVGVALLYPVLGARAKIRDRFDPDAGRSLDGTAFMRTSVLTEHGVVMPLADERAAMIWMLEHVDGSPVVAEVNTTPTLYGWELRYAMFTGNPAIVGWDYHQRQQRPTESTLVERRIADVQAMYATVDERAAYRTLSRYGASYVVVGPLERAYYPRGTAKWERGVGRYWDVAYENPGVRIYRVAQKQAG